MLTATSLKQPAELSVFSENNKKIVARFDMLECDDLYSPLEPSDFTYYQNNAEQYRKIVGAKRAGEIVFAAFNHRFENIAIALINGGADVTATIPNCSNSMLKSAEDNSFEKAAALIRTKLSTQPEETKESTQPTTSTKNEIRATF